MQTPNELLPDGLQMDLLWTNASPTSAFAAQTISLEFSIYTNIVIETVYISNDGINDNHSFTFCRKNLKNAIISPQGHGYGMGYRMATITDSKIEFVEGYANTTINNTAAVPIRIYGIK